MVIDTRLARHCNKAIDMLWGFKNTHSATYLAETLASTSYIENNDKLVAKALKLNFVIIFALILGRIWWIFK